MDESQGGDLGTEANVFGSVHSGPAAEHASGRRARIFGSPRLIGSVIAALALCGMLTLPAIASAATSGEIAGRVVSGAGGLEEPVEATEVCAVSASYETCVTTNAGGEYSIAGLPAGTYAVEFTGGSGCALDVSGETRRVECSKHPYISQFWDGISTYIESTKLEIDESKETATGIDAILQEGGAIEGVVEEAGTEKTIEGTSVCIGLGEPRTVCARTEAGGVYRLEGLQSSNDLEVVFSGGVCSAEGRECKTPYAAVSQTGIEVSAPDVTGGVDAEMELGGKIEGTVMTASIPEEPVAGMMVCAFAPSIPTVRCGDTDSSGEYVLEGLRTDAYYTVRFTGVVCPIEPAVGECTSPYLSQSATMVSVTQPATTANIDASMVQAPVKPVNTAAPTLTGAATVGQTLTCSEGSWSGSPTSLAYSWLRGGVPIAGQTGSTYVVQEADRGQTIACQVTASNTAGATSAISNGLAIAAPLPAKEETKPVVEGETKPIAREEVEPQLKAPAPEPKPGVAVAGRVAKSRGEHAMVKLHCTGGGSCEGSVKLVYKEKISQIVKRHGKMEIRHRTKTVIVGEAKFSIVAGGHDRLKVKLDKLGVALAKKGGRQGLNIRLYGHDVRGRGVRLKDLGRPNGKKSRGRRGHHRGHRASRGVRGGRRR